MKKLTCILGLIILLTGEFCGQVLDPQFTQFYSIPLYLSPSFAGSTQQQRFSASYREQWLAIPGAYSTYIGAYDHYFGKYNSGVGMMFMRDQSGSGKLSNTKLSLLYSYDIVVFNKSWHLRPGIGFIYNVFNIDFSKFLFFDQIYRDGSGASRTLSTESEPGNEGWRGHVDGSISGLGYNEKMWCGITVDHLMKPNVSFYNDKALTPIKYTFFGGYRLVSKGRLLRPTSESLTIACQYRLQGDFQQLDVGLYWYNSPLVLGFWYRGIPTVNSQRGDAVSFLAGVKMYKFSFGYSYDFTVSNLINSTRGAHEVSLIYEFYTKKKKKYHAIPCPDF